MPGLRLALETGKVISETEEKSITIIQLEEEEILKIRGKKRIVSGTYGQYQNGLTSFTRVSERME